MRVSRAALLAICVLQGTACETKTTTSDGTAPVRKPTLSPVAPAGTMPNAMAVTFGPKPADSDGNLFPDSLNITAYLFSKPHPAPLFCAGTFHFSIYRLGQSSSVETAGGEPLREWVMSAEVAHASRSIALAGPCYEFTLSLLSNHGSDALPVQSVDLVAWFEPSDASGRVWLRGVRSVQFARPEGR